MTLVLSLIAVLLLFSVGIFVAVRYYLFQNVTRATSHLDRLSENYARKEEEANKQLDEARERSTQILAEAGEEAEEIKTKASEETQEEREKVLKEARLQSEQIIQQANKTRDFLMGEMDKKIHEAAVLEACDLIREVIPDEIRKETHSLRLKELLVAGLEGLGNVSLPDTAREVCVTSACELTEDERFVLERELRKKIGDDIEIKEETDSGLIAGLSITVGGVVVDGSLRYSIQEAAKNVKDRD